jgi:ABC-type multidrug transport system fused ATPase/permease subunit
MDCAAITGTKPTEVKGQISFQNLHFHYPSRPEMKILNGVSFTVEAGQQIALVGHSGTTPLILSRRLLICRLWKIDFNFSVDAFL